MVKHNNSNNNINDNGHSGNRYSDNRYSDNGHSDNGHSVNRHSVNSDNENKHSTIFEGKNSKNGKMIIASSSAINKDIVKDKSSSTDFLKITDLKNMHINSELYKTFFYVAKFKSVSKAAEELFITQPAVSRSIRSLEEKLECKLFIRNSKGVLLTNEGETLFTYVEMALNFFFLGEKKLKQVKNLLEGELNIGVGDSICRHYLLPYLKKFNMDNPGITIHITNQKSFEIVKMLKSGEIDLGLVNLPLEDSQLRLTQVLEVHDCFVVGEKYRDLSEKPISLSELSKYPMMFIEKGSNSRRIIDNLFLDNKVRMAPSIELGNFELLTQFAEIDFGVACIIREFFKKEFDEGRIFEVPLKENIPTRGIGVASLKMVPLSPAAKAFIYLLRG